MSAYNDMDFSKLIIKRDDSTTDFFRNWDELLTSAKAERLLDYLTGKTHVKPEADVEALNKQTKHDESSLTQQIWQQITDNEQYAYLYATPIIAVNQNFPTQEEIDNSRTRILYSSNAYLAYLYKENEPEYYIMMQAETFNVSHADLLTTLLDTDPTTSTKNWKLNMW